MLVVRVRHKYESTVFFSVPKPFCRINSKRRIRKAWTPCFYCMMLDFILVWRFMQATMFRHGALTGTGAGHAVFDGWNAGLQIPYM